MISTKPKKIFFKENRKVDIIYINKYIVTKFNIKIYH